SNLVNGDNVGGSSTFNVMTTDIGGSSGTYSIDGGTLLSGTDPLSIHGNLETASGLDFSSAAQLRFSITSTDGSETTTLNVDLASGDTVQEFIDSVASQTSGRVTAQFDEETGELSLHSNEAFTVEYWVGTTLTDDTGVFGAGGSGTAMTGAPGAAATNQLTVTGFDFTLGATGQALENLTSSLNISTAAGAAAAVTAIDDALVNLNRDLATMGAQSKALDVQKTFLGKLSDSIEAGIGNLVDADLAKESARLQALQVKQQLGAQALSIANQAPSIVLSFFR
ncbi:MAG TPA: flagellin, partial [Verrucomicrobiae bacterium]|nr:flagellin [Verrucomicrobiae bacterium]